MKKRGTAGRVDVAGRLFGVEIPQPVRRHRFGDGRWACGTFLCGHGRGSRGAGVVLGRGDLARFVMNE